jgi:hypothetical protein
MGKPACTRLDTRLKTRRTGSSLQPGKIKYIYLCRQVSRILRRSDIQVM